MSALDDIRLRVADCRSYNFGMRNADKLAHEDTPALLGALDAVLALTDALEAEAVAAENARAELMRAPRTNGLRQVIYAYAQASSTSRNHAARIRSAAYIALEANK